MDSLQSNVVADQGSGLPADVYAGSVRGPELLAPAGDWACARAAVENGADAIYFGLERFNARMRAHNFTEADLPPLMDFLHQRGVKGYVTFNTLVFENELGEAEQYLRTLIAAGVDAAIVQDVGICRLIRELSPDFPIHASTQMTITSAGGVEFGRQLGCNLVVLARECSLKEIGEILQTNKGEEVSTVSGLDQKPGTLPIEVFVHGALCVAYSGQCLTSEALGGRSANRGECAQACRLPYELIRDGAPMDLGDRKYLLSPQDLAGIEVLPELAQLGVASLKIEGRLKSPEYVANITRVYRQALDTLTRRNPEPGQVTEEKKRSLLTPAVSYEMEMAFSRGLYTGWFRGINNQELVHGRFGKKRGVYLGKVKEIRDEAIAVDLEGPLKPGDGLVFDAGTPEEKEEGGRVYEIQNPKPARGNGKGLAWLSFGRGNIDFRRVHIGDRVWKTNDPDLDRRLRQSFEAIKFARPISIEVQGVVGNPLSLTARDEAGNVVRRDSVLPLSRADAQPLTTDRLKEYLGRLGGTGFQLGRIHNDLGDGLFLPASELNRLRRELVQGLAAARKRPRRWKLTTFQLEAKTAPPDSKQSSRVPRLRVLVRNVKQLEAVLSFRVPTVYCEFENPKKYYDAVQIVRGSAPKGSVAGTEIFVAPPRIFKMGEEWTLKHVRGCEADGYLVRNYDHLKAFAGARCVGDYSLNIANRLTAEYFKDQFQLERITASYDLNGAQLESLLRGAPAAWFEITIHQHMPMFHMEHCVFCAFLSQGTDYTDCGRPCDQHDLKLRDRVGAEHPVKADVGCRNTVFNARAQTGAEHVPALLACGARDFRVEFLNESPELVSRTLEQYDRLLRGEITGQQIWRELQLLNQLGVTRGQRF